MTDTQEGAPTTEALMQEICGYMAPLNKSGVPLTADTDIAADLEVDSVSVMDLVMTIEDAYDIMIPMNRLSEVRTVGDLTATVQSLIGKN